MEAFLFMKNNLIFLFISISALVFSQKKVNEKIETSLNNIEVFTEGLDNILLENSNSNFVEISLFDENLLQHHILVKEKSNILKVSFKINQLKEDETIFRKFITKRLQRAYAVIKVPKDKLVTFLGENINIESKSYKGNLSIIIEKGIINLNKVHKSVLVKLYAGTINASLSNTSIDVVSNIGKIKIDNKIVKRLYKKQDIKSANKFIVKSIKANIILTTNKVQ